jgi:hypothetical protein
MENILSNFWTNVPVYPSAEQITNATQNVEYDAETMREQTCPITMTEFNETSQILKIRECGHIFNENALRRWFRNHVTCPVCRCDIRTPSNEQSNEQSNVDNQESTRVSNLRNLSGLNDLNYNHIYYDIQYFCY